MERNPLIVIQSRYEENGMNDKKLPEADGASMVVQTWQRASKAGIGCVIIDCVDDKIDHAASNAGAYVYRTGPDEFLKNSNYITESGVERVATIVNKFDRFYNHDIIINLYDDMPVIDPKLIRALLYPLANLDVDIATLVCPIKDGTESDPDIVKVDIEWFAKKRIQILSNSKIGQAHNFSRDVREIDGPTFFQHIPIYAYKRASLDRFVRQEPSMRELEERLEPMRALENGMRIDVVMVDEQAVS